MKKILLLSLPLMLLLASCSTSKITDSYTNTSYVFEINLYDISSNSLIYSAESKTIDANSMATLANDYARSVVRDMKRKNVLG